MRQAGCWYYKVPMFTVSLLLGLFSNYVLAEESVVPDAIPGVIYELCDSKHTSG